MGRFLHKIKTSRKRVRIRIASKYVFMKLKIINSRTNENALPHEIFMPIR
jgi:hypothetical protein